MIFYVRQRTGGFLIMKKRFSHLITILFSCVIIACTVFFGSFSDYGDRVLEIKENVSAKISADETENSFRINRLNVKNILKNFGIGDNRADSPSSATSAPAATTQAASSSVKTTSAVSADTSAPTATTTTTVKAPEDESKNVEYIKDPDYKSIYYIVVYTGSQSAVVYGKDQTGAYNVIVKAFTVSTGKSSTPTRKGMYRIRAKYRWRLLMGPCYGQYSSSIGSSYLFHSVPYDKQRPDTLYNASYNNLGKAVSHGCIRMCVRDCKWIYDNCPIGTQVHVVWASGPKGMGVPQRKNGAKYSGWDPSDQWSEGNPYFADESDASSQTTTAVPTSASVSASTTSTASATSATSVTTASTASDSDPTAAASQIPDESSSEPEDASVI